MGLGFFALSVAGDLLSLSAEEWFELLAGERPDRAADPALVRAARRIRPPTRARAR